MSDKQLLSCLEIASVVDARSGVITTMDTGDSASGNVVGSSRDVTNAALVLVRARGRVDSRNGTLVRVVADVRSMTIMSKTLLLDDSRIGKQCREKDGQCGQREEGWGWCR